MTQKLRFMDCFAGIGGFRMALERLGFECVASCEIDKHARKAYKAIYRGEEPFYEDIRDIDPRELPDFDLLVGGFPCQAFSIAGKRGGFNDTRGTLFFELARIAKEKQPRLLLFENVKGLLSHDQGRTFGTILNTLDELGYDCEWQVLNSKDFGVPQNRERVFIVGHLRGGRTRKIFPLRRESAEASCVLAGKLALPGKDQWNRVYSPEGLSPTLTTMQGGRQEPKIAIPVLTPDRKEKRQNGRRFKENGEPMFTLTAQDRHGILVNMGKLKKSEVANCIDANYFKGLDNHQQRTGVKEGLRIRKLTPRECWRLQGFPDWAFDRAKEAGVSDSQLYKQAGNAVTVNVIDAIGRRLITTMSMTEGKGHERVLENRPV